MAATWTTDIVVTSLPDKLVSVTSTRTDGVDERTYTLPGVSVDTHETPLATIRAYVVNRIWALYQAELAKEAAMASLLSGWETAITNDLQAKETG